MMRLFMEAAAALTESGIAVGFFSRWLPLKKQRTGTCIYSTLFLLLILENMALRQKEGTANLSVAAWMLLVFAYAMIFQQGRIYEKISEALMPPMTMLPINMIVLYLMSIISGESIEALTHTGGCLRFLVLFFTKFLLHEMSCYSRRL